MIWLLALVYFVGASFLVRRNILTKTDPLKAEVTRLETLNEKTCDYGCDRRYICMQHSERRAKARRRYWYSVIAVPVLWPVLAPIWLWWKTLFPRGIRTPQMIAEAQEKKLKEQEAELQRLAQEIERMSKVAGLPVPKGLKQ